MIGVCHVPLSFQCMYGWSDERGGNGDGEEEESLDCLASCMRRGLKVNGGKSKVMVLGGEEGLKCEVCVEGMRLEHMSEYLNTWDVL